MNKFYIIVPVVLLGVFIFFYQGALKDMAAKEQRKKQEAAQVQAAEDTRRKEIEIRAAEDARRRQEERESQERAKEERRVRDYEDAMKQLRDEGNRYAKEADQLSQQANQLEVQLAELRTVRERANRETFDLSKQVELAKVQRRNAELEIQRLVDMVGQRVGVSSVATMPPPPPPARK
jgi:chromosome segregation ATPase